MISDHDWQPSWILGLFWKVNKLYISPYLKNIFIEIRSDMRGSCAAQQDGIYQFYIFIILDITAFRKSKIYIALWQVVPAAAAIYIQMCV